MKKGKKRAESHIKGEEGIRLVKKYLPKEWVVREYFSDYGIDLSVELFDDYESGGATKGEHIFFQVKATDFVAKSEYTLRDGDFTNDKVEVIKFILDTDLLSTVERMGPAVPVILAVVELQTECVYFVCLNDYIDKVLLPEDPTYDEKFTKTIYIPSGNRLDCEDGIKIIEWYAKRPKLYALINKINCQKKSLEYCIQKDLYKRIEKYIKELYRLDVWDNTDCFGYMDAMKPKLDYFIENGITPDAEEIIQREIKCGKDVDEEIYESTYCNGLVSIRKTQEVWGIHSLWEQLSMLDELLEKIAREAYLPTGLYQFTAR